MCGLGMCGFCVKGDCRFSAKPVDDRRVSAIIQAGYPALGTSRAKYYPLAVTICLGRA